MDKFIARKQFLLNKFSQTKQQDLLSKISVSTKKYGEDLLVHTYKLNIKNNSFGDDKIYSENLELIDILPRGCSILVENGIDIGIIEGNAKFSGKTPIEEDQEDDKSDDSKIIKYMTIK